MELLLFTLITSVLVVIGRSTSDFCHGKPCPAYKVVETNKDFEERRYGVTYWITTKIDSTWDSAVIAASNRLRYYCLAQEEAGHKIGCYDSWPTLITLTDGEDGPYYKMSWFVPGLLPEDTDPDPFVNVEQRPAATVYVRVFGGTPRLQLGQNEAQILCKDLKTAGKPVDCHNYTGASFDYFLSLSHHNEIWIYATE